MRETDVDSREVLPHLLVEVYSNSTICLSPSEEGPKDRRILDPYTDVRRLYVKSVSTGETL